MKQSGVYFSGKQVHFSMSYDCGKNVRPVPEAAMIQILVTYFGISERHLEDNWRTAWRGRKWKPLLRRSKKERYGAFVMAYWWLLSFPENADLKAKAAPWSRPVLGVMGEAQWHCMAEWFGFSFTDRMELLMASKDRKEGIA